MPSRDEGRRFLRSLDWHLWSQEPTDQRRGIPAPALEQALPAGVETLALPAVESLTLGEMPLREAIRRRRSRRRYTDAPLSLEELSFLLWATQGVSGKLRGDVILRTVPSGGNRHPFETYLWVNRVTGMRAGLYRYLPLRHHLALLRADETLGAQLGAACNGQAFVGQAAATFIWTAVPYRMEWRYTVVAHKVIAQETGHVCQNLYLAAEALGCGVCAIGAYDQSALDALLGVDGEEEFAIYVAPVGRVA